MVKSGLCPEPQEERPQLSAGLIYPKMASPKTWYLSFKVWDQILLETKEVPIQSLPPEIMHFRP